MKNTKEQQILKIIKFTPPLFIIVISFLITSFLYIENKRIFLEEKTRVEKLYIQENKELIKEEILRVHSFIKRLQKNTEIQLKETIKSRVYEAHEIASNIFEKYKKTKTKEEIFEIIKIALEKIRFNEGRGYFFIDDVYGNKLLYPIDKNLEGKNLLSYKDINGYKTMENIVKIIKNKSESFDEYYWYKPNEIKNKTFRKIAFYKSFAPLNIAIGTGEYLDDYSKKVQQRVLDYIDLIKFAKNGYIFVINYDSIYLSHVRKSFIGKNAITNNDTKKIRKVIEDLTSISKKGEGYYSYVQNKKPGTNRATKKISFVKGINEWEWMIGTGFYEDDVSSVIEQRKESIDKKFNTYVQNIVIISLLLTIVLLFISIYVSKLLEDKFNDYKKDLSKKQSLLFQQSKMAAMGEMIGNIAHQWRQPLSTISTASSGMAINKQMGTLEDEFFYDATDKINKSAQHLSKTIDDFRNFFSPNKEKKHFNINNTFLTTLDLVDAQFKARDIKIIKDIENISLYNYENELIQSLINILNNARDELIKKPNDFKKLIFINVKIKNKKLLISIKDNAGGIPTSLIDRIFEPYFTTKHKSQGTGIGLYMTEEIIIKHLKGDIFVSNEEYIFEGQNYKGALFKIQLEINDQDS